MQEIIILLARFLIIIPFLAVFAWVFLKKELKLLFQIIIAVLLVNILSFVFKVLLPFKRPYVGTAYNPGIWTLGEGSFFSGHTGSLFALGTVLWFCNRPLAYFSFAFGILVGILRVFIKVHYPLDIVGGMFFGLLVGYFTYNSFKRYSSL